ncbi:AAA family ATPase [Actinophytocola sp. NPDC049390]|uniref:AAA family ATPase n=1 Tax=Actinophytocola sp. NPDC049390 TaxID=3363894 RepID=UPI003799B995
MTEPLGALHGRLQAARLRAFVGRKEERAAFDEALCGGGVLFVHGPGGVGKSALLRCFAQRAAEAGRTVTVLDGRVLVPSPTAFLAEAGPVLADERAVLLVDAIERLDGLAGWLRERFLPRLPAGAVVVVAGRVAPDVTWRADPGWAEVVRVIRLGDLDPMDADALLESRGVAGVLRDQLLAFAGGHPLALTLGAAAVLDGRRPHDLVAALLDDVVGDVPGPAHRQALDVCALTYRSTQDVLRAVLPGADAAALFSWLRRLPFVESSPFGLFPHDVVRQALDADLRWRDPEGHADLRLRVRAHLTERIHAADDADVLRAVGSLFYLHRAEGRAPGPHVWRAVDEVYEDVFRPEDADDVLRLAAEWDAAEVVAHWTTRQPDAFRLYRTIADGELAGVSAWLRVASERDSEADPVVAAAWAHARATAPPRPGEHLAVHRSWVRARRGGTSPVVSLIRWRAVGWLLRSDHLAWSFGAEPPAHDWRTVPARVWLDRVLSGAREPMVQHEPELTVLSQDEFADAVRKTLRHLSKHAELARNPLTRSRLLAGRADPVGALRELVEDAIRALGRDPRAAKPHRALDMTYLRGAPTQEVAAERLGLSFSTYRRHLVAGVERISEDLWRRELSG